MSDAYIGEIRMVGFTFAPKGWAFCNGQLLSIAQNTALFSLLGTQFGGDGRTNFALPNLQGCVPMNQGAGAGLSPRTVGETGGEPAVTLNAAQLPPHAHAANCVNGVGDQGGPSGNTWAAEGRGRPPSYSDAGGNVALSNQALLPAGSNQPPHNNLSPYLAVGFIIALTGIFPPRS